jgi:DNA-binding MarR family transcriptional regulator
MKRLEGIDPDIRGVLEDMNERAQLYHLTDEKRNLLQQLASNSEEFLQQLDQDFPV